MHNDYYQPPSAELGGTPTVSSTTGTYLDQRLPVRILGAGLICHALLSLALFAVHVWTVSLMNQISTGVFSQGDLETRDALASMMQNLRSLCYWGTGIVTLAYLHRASHNARALGAEGMEFTPGWTVGWWFIPLANWFKPYAAVKELWTASGHGDASFRVPAVLPLWWAAYMTMSLGGTFTGLMFASRSPSGLATASIFHALVVIVGVAAAYLAWQVLSGIHERQTAKAAELSNVT